MKEGVDEKIRAAGGEVYAVSSEPQALCDRALREWSLSFETVGDPHQEIAGACRKRGWVDLFVNEHLEFLRMSAGDGDWAPTHPKGYFQPGVLALNTKGRVLYRWRGVPTRRNMGGALERPTAQHVWSEVASALGNDANSSDAPLDADPPLDSRGLPWSLFTALLIANGWFVKARGFKSPKRIAYAGIRLLGFVGLWIAAFAWLPVLLVGTAFVAWALFISRHVRWVSEQFQNVELSST